MEIDTARMQVTVADAGALAAWNKLIHAVLAHRADAPQHLQQVLAAAPGWAMAHAAQSLFAMMAGRRELVIAAQSAAKAAEKALAKNGGTARERAWVAAAMAWTGGRPDIAAAQLGSIVVAHPGDTLTLKVAHAVRFMIGDAAGMRHDAETAIHAHGADHPLTGYAHGCLAFAREETGAFQAAEAAGYIALDRAQDDAWGLHAIAHVYEMTHQTARGIALIDANSGAWQHSNNFRFHVWWHKALLHLDRAEHDLVLALYDQKIRSEQTDDYRDIANAASLLSRLELEGISVGDRWRALAELAEQRSDDGSLAFADLHYLLALVGDGRGQVAQTMAERMAPSDTAMPCSTPARDVAQGMIAFAAGRYAQACDSLMAALPNLQTIGGSHAQRDVFERLAIEAGMRAGAFDQTEQALACRRARRAGTKDAFAAARLAQIQFARLASAAMIAE